MSLKVFQCKLKVEPDRATLTPLRTQVSLDFCEAKSTYVRYDTFNLPAGNRVGNARLTAEGYLRKGNTEIGLWSLY